MTMANAAMMTVNEPPRIPRYFPMNDAATPRIVKVMDSPNTKTSEYITAFFLSPPEYPPTKPIMRGIAARTQGLKAETSPPTKTKI